MLEKALDFALKEPNRQVEAEARYHLATALNFKGEYAASDAHLKVALPLFEEFGNIRMASASMVGLGENARGVGNTDLARQYFEKALKNYESVNEWAPVAYLHDFLSQVTSGEEERNHIQKGLELARKVGDRALEARFLHSWADNDYATDDFSSALERLDQARVIFEELRKEFDLARVYTSMGRLYRVHGRAEQAIPFYQRAIDLQKRQGDKPGIIQSLNAISVALNVLGRQTEALANQEQALKLARETGDPFLIKFMMEGVAYVLMQLKEYSKAAEMLEAARTMSTPRANTFRLLSLTRFQMAQYEQALQAAEEGIKIGDVGEFRRDLFQARAQALWKLGRTSEALRDVQIALNSMEETRATLVPTDFMKQNYMDRSLDLTDLAIQVLIDSGQDSQALATAEQARSRAFLDLLATKNLATKEQPASAKVTGGPRLLNVASVAPASTEELRALSVRLNSTLLLYWVGFNSSIAWTVAPDGKVTTARIAGGVQTIDKSIDEAIRPPKQPATRGQSLELPSRAGDAILTRRNTQQAWQRLYNLLIRPVRSSLPPKGNGRLTIIPSGPLFRLSFAALMDENGRYLIEDYSLSYAPAGEVLSFTSRTKTRTADQPNRYLLVANPSSMPSVDGKALPALPGSDDEVRRIVRILPNDSVTTLRGAEAVEPSVRAAMASAKVIHLATHGIVSNADPLGSFLALGKGGSETQGDGRLTAEEVYGLELNADLVVLSACRSGLGQISGDGVAGLARAFFYAGAASVVSTLWDVADGPASQLVAEFYTSLTRSNGHDKSEALRAAQLSLLRALRRGQVRVDTPFGRLPLQEDPIIWAGFVLIGEP